MSNYTCSIFGCSPDAGGVYTSLQNCESACVGWGCPDSLNLTTNIYFIYDGSNSFSSAERLNLKTQSDAYIASITLDGWLGQSYNVQTDIPWLNAPVVTYNWHHHLTASTVGNGYIMNVEVPSWTSLIPPNSILSADCAFVIFTNEVTDYTGGLWFSWVNPPIGTYINHEAGYNALRNDILTASPPGSIKALLMPISNNSPSSAGVEKLFTQHAIAAIMGGNQNLSGGLGAIDGTWQSGTAPVTSGTINGVPLLCNSDVAGFGPPFNYNTYLEWDGTATNPNQYWLQFGYTLDSRGWYLDPTFDSVMGTGFQSAIQSMLGTVSNTATICTTAETWNSATLPTGGTHPDFPYSAQTDCDSGCFGGGCKNPTMMNYDSFANLDCTLNPLWSGTGPNGYGDESCCWDDPRKCTDSGCVSYTPVQGEVVQYNSIEECLTGCTSYECTVSGMSLYNDTGNTGTNGTYTGAGNLGTGGTYSTALAGSSDCRSWGCSGGTVGVWDHCYLYNQTGTTNWTGQGSNGTGGTFSSNSNVVGGCQYECQSFDCSSAGIGCLSSAGNGSGGTYNYPTYGSLAAASSACQVGCVSYECGDYGCTESQNTGGTYSTLVSCTAACQSWECVTTGCQMWNKVDYPTAPSYIVATSYGTQGTGGTGGTATYNGCTGNCFTWDCTNQGCVKNPGSDPFAQYQANEFSQCNTECRSKDCGSSGCYVYNSAGGYGTGGTYVGATMSQDCDSECGSYNCGPLTVNTPTNNTEWNVDSCVFQPGTGGTHFIGSNYPGSILASSVLCATACTSWSCQNPDANTAGCVEYPNTGNTYSQASYSACTAQTICQRYDCTDTGCIIGDPDTAAYASLGICESSCKSWACTTSGCSLYNATGTSTWSGSGNLGTGGTYNNNTCQSADPNLTCDSYNCTPTGCFQQPGTGGTYTIALYGTDYDNCDYQCESFNCTPTGCVPQAGSGGTFSSSNACGAVCESYNCTDTGCELILGTGGTFSAESACTGTCITWNCTDNGCVSQEGTGGTYSTLASCTGTCDSYNCSLTGCEIQAGTGGTYTEVLYPLTYDVCDNTCLSYNCTPSGCVSQTGTGGDYATIGNCQSSCESWDCTVIGCITQVGTGGTYTIVNDGALASDCMGICDSWDCTPTGCEGYNILGSNSNLNNMGGTGGTYSSSSDCGDVCESYNCTDTGCFSQLGTGGTNTYESGCTGTCVSYNCTPTGCISQVGTGGTYSSLNDCNVGTSSNNYTDACTSWNCGGSGCVVQQGDGGTYPTEIICTGFCQSYNCTPTGCVVQQGDGGMFVDLPTCESSCDSYNCGINGCIPQVGTGGTYTIALYPSTYGVCNNVCNSWNCTDIACVQYNLLPGPTYIDGLGGTGGTYDNSSCDNVCVSHECEFYGCQTYNGGVGTGGTYSTNLACSTDCKSWDCLANGCGNFNGGDGTGGTYNYLIDCTSLCKSYNCLPTGCALHVGNSGTWADLPNCIGGCESWDCTTTGCSRYNFNATLGNSATYTNGSGGTAGSYPTDIACSTDCQSWDCTNTGCEEYNIVGSSNPPGNNNNQGTGGTYTILGNAFPSTCDNTCESWECTYIPLVNPLAYNTSDACLQHIGTGHTYGSAFNCSTGCTSWTCLGLGTIGCTEFPNTASTYVSESTCTASTSCAYYDCTLAGCVLQPGEYTGGIDSYLLEQDCLDNCVGWGCLTNTLASGTSIYVYYEAQHFPWGPIISIPVLRDTFETWLTNTHPTHSGSIYHTIVSDGRWLDWTNSIYNNYFSVPPGTGSTLYQPTDLYDQDALLAIDYLSSVGNTATYPNQTDWYDQYSAGTYLNVLMQPGQSSPTYEDITTNGIAPTAHTTGDTLVIAFVVGEKDLFGLQSNGPQIPPAPLGTGINGNYKYNKYHDSVISTGSVPYLVGQPTTAWTTDYTANTIHHNAVTAATGTLRGMLVPYAGTFPHPTLGPGNSMCMLHGLAAIRPGNNTTKDGMYQIGTSPTTSFGADLSQIENMNPYWNSTTPTYGNLEFKGWAIHLGGEQVYNHLNPYNTYTAPYTPTLNYHLQVTAPVIGGCVSAETLYTANVVFPYSTSATCDSICEPEYYVCTTTGCSLSWAGTMTLNQCETACKSVSCTSSSSVGCEDYNSPGSLTESNGLYGTGGTFTGVNAMSDCQLQCFSYSCEPVLDFTVDVGCQSHVGSGQTYYETTPILSYSACTGDCRSWECNDRCKVDANNVSIGTGCLEYQNTGATYTAFTSCTGTCQENWYCTTASTIDSCDGLIFSTITSGNIDDHIDKLASTAGWNNMLFYDFKFLYITTPTNPLNTCYSASSNAYWAQVKSMELTLSSTIPVSTIAYTWYDVVTFMNTYYPTTIIYDVDDIENVGGVTITYEYDLCSCVDIPCTIGCTGGTITQPSNVIGPHATYAIAEDDCCSATTWSCDTNTIVDNCDGLTLIPGLFTDVEGCYEWLGQTVGTYGLNITSFKCEVMPSLPLPPIPLAQCDLGPNYGQLIRLTGITSSISQIAANTYTSLTGYTYALQNLSPPVTNAVNGLPLDVLQDKVQLVYASSSVYYGWSDCECDNPYSCGCVEMFDGSGPYTSKTQCELSCCSATTWDCVNSTQYQPICGSKTYLGMTPDTTTLLEHYHLSAPTEVFGLNTFIIGVNPMITWAQVQTNMALAGPPWTWNDCYNFVGGVYAPTVYLYTVSHPMINGGTPYQTWNDFYTATNNVTSSLAVSDTISDINTKINAHFGTTIFNVVLDVKSCCSGDDCYCYDTLDSNGQHANELLCDTSCCPSTQMSWSCELDSTGSYGCALGAYGPPINTTLPSLGPWATINECQTLSLGGCSTSWKCVPSMSSCDCTEVVGHYTVTGQYPTEWFCNNNTNINDCCGLPVTYTCDTGTITSNMTGLSSITGITGTTLGFPNLGYITIDDVLTHLSNPLSSPSNQISDVTNFSFCLNETSQTILNSLPSHCKCGDGCDGVVHKATGFTFSNFNLGYTDTVNPFDIINYPYGYCTTWAEFIDQLNIVWGPGIFSVNLSMTYQQVVDEVQNGIGVSQFGLGLESCVDSSSPCGCIGNTLGIGVSLADCSSSCCTETITYTCTIQGCRSRCDGTGEYQNLQMCEEECWELRCNQDIWGCTDPTASNYNPLATIDDGTCVLPNDYWSCSIAEGCDAKTVIAGGLSYTAAIYSIVGNSSFHSVPFDTLKYDLGGGNQQNHPSGGNNHLPCEPCDVPGMSQGQPGPYYAYIKYVMYTGLGSTQYITWSSFIDAINLLGYSFTYFNSWQDLEAVLGQSQLNCVWDWCDCSGARTCVPDSNGNYVSSGQCYSDTNNDCTSWRCNSQFVESCSGSTTYMGPYTNFNHAEDDYIATYPTVNLSAFTFSVATIPLNNTGYWASAGIPPCAPPPQTPPVPLSMFPLLTFTGITVNPLSTIASSMSQLTFTNWGDLINAINGAALTGLVVNVGMTMTNLVQEISLAGYNTAPLGGLGLINFSWGYCACGLVDCHCIEVPDGTGPYQSLTCCEDDDSDDNCCYFNWDCPGTP